MPFLTSPVELESGVMEVGEPKPTKVEIDSRQYQHIRGSHEYSAVSSLHGRRNSREKYDESVSNSMEVSPAGKRSDRQATNESREVMSHKNEKRSTHLTPVSHVITQKIIGSAQSLVSLKGTNFKQ